MKSIVLLVSNSVSNSSSVGGSPGVDRWDKLSAAVTIKPVLVVVQVIIFVPFSKW